MKTQKSSQLQKRFFSIRKEADPMVQVEESSQSWDVGKK